MSEAPSKKNYSHLILITCPPRSGTTWLNRELCSGAAAFPFLPECTFLTQQVELYNRIINYSDKKRFMAYFQNRHNLTTLFRENIARQIDQAASLNKKTDANVLVLKDPGLSLHLEASEALFPEHYLIVLLRDPRNVIASMKKVSLKKETDFEIKKTADEIFMYYYKIGIFYKKNNENSIFVRYEDLVTGKTEDLQGFLPDGLMPSVSTGEIDLSELKQKLDPSDPFFSEHYFHPTTDQTIASYVNILSEDEINYIDNIFSGVIQCWGYGSQKG